MKKYDQTVEGHVSIPVQCTTKTCPDRNRPHPTTHVISAEDAGDDNVESYNQKCHVYLVDSEDQIDMENPVYCPQNDPKKGEVSKKIDNFFQTDESNQPPKGDGKGVSTRVLSGALNEEGGGYVKNRRFFIKRESPPAFKAFVERCSKCQKLKKPVNESDRHKTITIQDLDDRKAAGQIG